MLAKILQAIAATCGAITFFASVIGGSLSLMPTSAAILCCAISVVIVWFASDIHE